MRPHLAWYKSSQRSAGATAAWPADPAALTRPGARSGLCPESTAYSARLPMQRVLPARAQCSWPMSCTSASRNGRYAHWRHAVKLVDSTKTRPRFLPVPMLCYTASGRHPVRLSARSIAVAMDYHDGRQSAAIGLDLCAFFAHVLRARLACTRPSWSMAAFVKGEAHVQE